MPPRPRFCCATGPCAAESPARRSRRARTLPPRRPARIHICLCGAMSHIDTFDYKPGLIAAHGKPVNSSTKPDTFFGQIGRLRKPDWALSAAR